nr:MAG TPA: hypothetical protein [Caudoviricetes sp.]
MSNKFKIIHTSKKTGVETVIFDNTSDSVIEDVGNLLIGVPITESVDDGMSTAVLHLKSCIGDVAVPALFEPYDKVEIEKDLNGIKQSELYVVAIDNRKVDNENLKTYEKTISLVEATKILDSIFIYNCNLTNKTDTLKDQIAKLLNNAEIGVEKSRWLQCEAATATYSVFNGYKSEDFFFDNITLREALYRIFEVAHFRPHVSAINYVGGDIKYINIEPISQINTKEISSLDSAGDFIGDEAEISIDNFFGTIKARGYNSISKNTIKTGELPFTTSEAQLTTNNMIADLGFPIEDIKSFKVGGSKIRISVTYYRNTTQELTYVDLAYFYDITDKIVDNSIYSLLSKDEQNLTMPYTKGDSTIGFSKSYKTLLFTHSSISEILNLDLKKLGNSDIYKYCKENNIADTSGTTGYLGNVAITDIKFTNGIESLFFQAEFIPRFNTVIEISKPGVYDNDRLQVAIADNQSANTIDISRHGRALAGLARRTGNEEITPNFICNGFNNLLPVMGKFTGITGRDSYLNDYIVTKREYAIYDDYLKVKYYCTKDYQAVNEKIGVNREKRLYNIPLESSDCPIYVKYYVTVDITAKTNSTGFKASILYNSILNFVLNSYNNNFRLAYLYLATKEARSEQAIDGKLVTQLENNQYFALPLLPYASDKCITFIAQPLDNYSVGYSRSGREFSYWGGGGMQMLYNPYTDKNGECDGFTVCLASRQSVANNVSSYPKVTKGGETLISDDVQISYKKDRTQRPVFFIAFEFLPSKELYGKIVFGEAIASQNFLVVSEAPEKRYVYSSGEIYREGETKIKGARVGEALNYFIPSLHDTEKTVYLRVQKDMPLSSSIKSYAIGDESGNLLIAFNMALTKDEKLYFNISRKL